MGEDWPQSPAPTRPASTPAEAGGTAGSIVPVRLGGVPAAPSPQRPRQLYRWLRIVLPVAFLSAAAGAAWLLVPPAVVVVAPARGAAVDAIYATGSVQATTLVPIAGRITSTLAAVEADEGDRVAEGQLLARFDDRDLQAVLQQLRAQEDYARQEYERLQRLRESGAVSQSAYDRAMSDWLSAKSATARAVAEASYMELRAPIDGTIVKREGEVGALIPANQAIFWVTRDDALRISTEVDEEDIARVAPGQEVLVRADAFEGSVFTGRVQAITPLGDPVARTYRVRIGLEGETPLLIGMTVETNIVVRRDENAVLLPASAVVDGKVWVVADGRLEPRAVTVGVSGAGRVEIRSGVADEDRVVVQPDPSFAAGERVRSETADVP